jgi:hypothetical protein
VCIILKMDLKEIMCEGMDLNSSGSAQNPIACGVNTVLNLMVSKQAGNFWVLSNRWLLKKDSVPWSWFLRMWREAFEGLRNTTNLPQCPQLHINVLLLIARQRLSEHINACAVTSNNSRGKVFPLWSAPRNNRGPVFSVRGPCREDITEYENGN